MTWAKKKKMITIIGTVSLVLTVPQFASIPFYVKLNSSTVSVNGTNRVTDPSLIDGANSASKIDNSNKDQNLDKNIAPPARTPIVSVEPPKTAAVPDKAKDEPIPPTTTTPIAPVDQPVPEVPVATTPVESVPDVPPVVVKPEPTPRPPSTGSFIPGPDEHIVDTSISFNIPDPTIVRLADGTTSTSTKTIRVPVRIITKKPVPRHSFPESDKEILNRVPYTSNVSPEILNIEITDEYVEALRTSYIAVLKFDVEKGFGIEKDRNDPEEKRKIDFKVLKPEWSLDNRYKIDYDNLKLNAAALDKIKQGFTLSPHNLIIDRNGELDANSWGPINDAYNKTVSLYKKDNETLRYFSYSNGYSRGTEDILNGNFSGWTKKDVKSEFLKFGLSEGDGIDVFRYTNDDPKFADKNNSNRVVLDAANAAGYNKYINFLKRVSEAGIKIQSYLIKNVGKGSDGVNQRFNDILKALPENIPNLELWLGQPTNTTFLYSLRNKKIDELALYTSENSLLSDWSINPLSLQNTAYIQSQDYHVSSSYVQGYRPLTKVNIKTLAVDAVNYKPNEADPFKEINLALRMAYYVRNNERFFQGEHGPGVENPDNSEKTNTAWPYLDLSRIPQLRSLRGLNFDFGEGNNKFSRQVSRLTLYNDSPVFTISVDELNNSQFHKVMNFPEGPGAPKDMLRFKGANVTDLRVVGNGVSLTAEGKKNLETFYRKIGKDVFNARPIMVNKDDSIASELRSSGITTTVYNSVVDVNIN